MQPTNLISYLAQKKKEEIICALTKFQVEW
jgi:hypothetical protein